jgi:hypothetical protein
MKSSNGFALMPWRKLHEAGRDLDKVPRDLLVYDANQGCVARLPLPWPMHTTLAVLLTQIYRLFHIDPDRP